LLGLATVILLLGAFERRLPAGAPLTSREATCTSLMVVMNPAGSTFELIALQELKDAGVRLLYEAQAPGGAPQRRTLACGFDEYAGALAAVSVDGTPLGPARLALLKRFWLDSGAAASALPPVGAPQRMPPALAPDWLTWARPGGAD
jgi:hypothetical protein